MPLYASARLSSISGMVIDCADASRTNLAVRAASSVVNKSSVSQIAFEAVYFAEKSLARVRVCAGSVMVKILLTMVGVVEMLTKLAAQGSMIVSDVVEVLTVLIPRAPCTVPSIVIV